MSHYHDIAGKKTTHGHIVHYTDPAGTSHAAIIKSITALPDNGGHHANLHVFQSDNAGHGHIADVPHDPHGAPHTWKHIEEE